MDFLKCHFGEAFFLYEHSFSVKRFVSVFSLQLSFTGCLKSIKHYMISTDFENYFKQKKKELLLLNKKKLIQEILNIKCNTYLFPNYKCQ